MILLGIQMEKKIAPSPPSFMRGISMLPVELRVPRSNLPSRKRCVVSSCVSTTMDEKCSLRAFSEMESAETASATRQTEETYTTTSKSARTMIPPNKTIDGNGNRFRVPLDQPT